MTPQEQVAEAISQRGYRDGYTAYQFLARNLVKMAEELNEAASFVYLESTKLAGPTPGTTLAFRLLGELARVRFDERDPTAWVSHAPHRGLLDALGKELADMQVVLLNAAQAFAELRGEPFDVVAEAVKKATTDVARGVRGQG